MIRSLSPLHLPAARAASPRRAEAGPAGDAVEISAGARRPAGGLKMAMALAFMASLGACSTLPSGSQPHLLAQETVAAPTCGQLVPVGRQVPGRPLQVSVHGMNGTPDNLRSLTAQAASQGFNTAAFAYEDRQCTLAETAADMTRQLGEWRARNPGQTLRVDAHCMGARVAVRALADMGLAAGRVQLNLFTPPLAGFALANTANWVPRGVARLFPGTLPGQDMGSRSPFQRRLEATTLPAGVETNIYYGQRDEIIDYTDPTFGVIERNLGARVHYVANAGHMEVLDEVPRGNFASERLEYQRPSGLKAMISF